MQFYVPEPGNYQLKAVIDGIESDFSGIIQIKNVEITLLQYCLEALQYIMIFGLVLILAATNMPNSECFWSLVGIIFSFGGIVVTFYGKHGKLFIYFTSSIYGLAIAFLLYIFIFSLIPCCKGRRHFQLREIAFANYTKKTLINIQQTGDVSLKLIIF